MYKFIFVLLFFGCALSVHAEEITNFNSHLVVQKDGTVLVTETISYDFGSQFLHGIFRTLQKQHPQEATTWYKKRLIDIDIVSVEKDGVAEPYAVADSRNEVEVKIGDPNITISGLHTYTINYKLTGALSYGPLGSEFYYNVTGDNWLVPITKTTAEVVDSTGTLLATSSDCYQGVYGDTTRCTKGLKTATSSVFTAGLIVPGSGLTIAQELNAEQVAVLINEEISINWIGYVLGVLWLIGLSIWAYRFRTQFKSNKPVIAQYEPYEGILPMYTGVLFDGKLDPQDITAGIVYLAEQGYIKIRKTEEKVLFVFNTSDYELTLLRTDTEVLPKMLQQILKLLFTDMIGDIVTEFRLRSLRKLTSNETSGIVHTMTVGTTVKISSLSKKRSSNNLVLSELQKSVVTNLENDGFIFKDLFHSQLNAKYTAITLFGVIGLLLLCFVLKSLFLAAIVCISFGLLVVVNYGRRTTKGYEAQNYLKGFKLFLSVTEKERYTFFNAPEKSPEVFMKYLPYAIAFKVEKEWSKVFEGITMPNPTWYEGAHLGAFSAVAFSNDIGAFSSSFARSSGTSGSSGGGSSGGGGGGGGGGSW